MKCFICKKEINRAIDKSKVKRNNHFFCDKKCYLGQKQREVIQNYNFFETVDTEEKAYWLGFIYADGCVSSKGYSIQINLSSKDHNHLKKISNIFGKEISNYKDNLGYHKSQLHIYSVKLHSDLIKNGVVPRKTYIDSNIIFDCVPQNLLNHFIRGYFDGDGCISVDNRNLKQKRGTVSIAGTKTFITKIKKIILDKIGLNDTKLHKTYYIYILSWGGKKQIEAIYYYLYKNATIFLERKKEKFEELGKFIPQGKSKYIGVQWYKKSKKWLAKITIKGTKIKLGYFVNEETAAEAYDNAIIKYNLPKYKLNFK